eukprot:1065922-Amphidinium_carterae.1
MEGDFSDEDPEKELAQTQGVQLAQERIAFVHSSFASLVEFVGLLISFVLVALSTGSCRMLQPKGHPNHERQQMPQISVHSSGPFPTSCIVQYPFWENTLACLSCSFDGNEAMRIQWMSN